MNAEATTCRRRCKTLLRVLDARIGFSFAPPIPAGAYTHADLKPGETVRLRLGGEALAAKVGAGE